MCFVSEDTGNKNTFKGIVHRDVTQKELQLGYVLDKIM